MERKSTEEINNGYDPLSDDECSEVVSELDGISDSAERAGHLNSWGCDVWHAAQKDVMVNGPLNTATNKTMTKAEALAWIEKVYAE